VIAVLEQVCVRCFDLDLHVRAVHVYLKDN
jgi:hypothetical protein